MAIDFTLINLVKLNPLLINLNRIQSVYRLHIYYLVKMNPLLININHIQSVYWSGSIDYHGWIRMGITITQSLI